MPALQPPSILPPTMLSTAKAGRRSCCRRASRLATSGAAHLSTVVEKSSPSDPPAFHDPYQRIHRAVLRAAYYGQRELNSQSSASDPSTSLPSSNTYRQHGYRPTPYRDLHRGQVELRQEECMQIGGVGRQLKRSTSRKKTTPGRRHLSTSAASQLEDDRLAASSVPSSSRLDDFAAASTSTPGKSRVGPKFSEELVQDEVEDVLDAGVEGVDAAESASAYVGKGKERGAAGLSNLGTLVPGCWIQATRCVAGRRRD
jgi:hypothetical protein